MNNGEYTTLVILKREHLKKKDLLFEITVSLPMNEEEEIGSLLFKMEFDHEVTNLENREVLLEIYNSYHTYGLINTNIRGFCTYVVNHSDGRIVMCLSSHPYEREIRDDKLTYDPLS